MDSRGTSASLGVGAHRTSEAQVWWTDSLGVYGEQEKTCAPLPRTSMLMHKCPPTSPPRTLPLRRPSPVSPAGLFVLQELGF